MTIMVLNGYGKVVLNGTSGNMVLNDRIIDSLACLVDISNYSCSIQLFQDHLLIGRNPVAATSIVCVFGL